MNAAGRTSALPCVALIIAGPLLALVGQLVLPRHDFTPPRVLADDVRQVIDDASAPLPMAMRVTMASFCHGELCHGECPCGPACECHGCRCLAQQQPAPTKPRLLAFSAPTCPACLKMKRDIEANPELQAAINAKYSVTVYKEPRKDRAAFKEYGIRGVPACVLLDADGKEVRRFTGYKSPGELARWLEVDAKRQPEQIEQQQPETVKPALLYFTAVVSPASRWFERWTLADPAVVQKLAAYNWTRYRAPGDRDAADKHAVTAVPTVILIGTDGKEVRRFVGYKSTADFLQWLAK